MKTARFPYAPGMSIGYGQRVPHSAARSWFSATCLLPRRTAASMCMTICGRSCLRWAFRKTRSLISTPPTPSKRKRSCLPRCAAARCVSSWAAPQKWAPAPMCRTGSSPCMISIAHGGPATCSSALGASCGRATKIRRWRSSAMLPRAHSMPTSISWWNPSSGLLPRS